MIATRSPLRDALLLQLVREREHGAREGVEGDPLVLVDQERAVAESAADLRTLSRSVGGQFFQTRVRTPRMISSSISKRAPGAVRRRVRRLDRHRRPVGRKRRHRRDCLSRGALRHAHLAREPHNAAAHCRGRDSNRQSALTMLKQGRLGSGCWALARVPDKHDRDFSDQSPAPRAQYRLVRTSPTRPAPGSRACCAKGCDRR